MRQTSFDCRPSLQIAGFLAFLHLMIASVMVYKLLLWSLLALPIVAISAVMTIRRYAWLSDKRAIIRLSHQSDYDWMLLTYAGLEMMTELKVYTLLGQFAIVLKFKDYQSSRHVSQLLAADSMDKESMRRLRVLLLHGQQKR